MTTSTSRLSFTDCYEAFDQALADERGIRIRCTTIDAAIHLRMRMHTARGIDRKDNRMIYAETPDHPLFGRSIYDRLVLRIREAEGEARWLYIEQIALRGEVQALSSLPADQWEPSPQIERQAPQALVLEHPAPQLQIEHVKRRV